MALVVKDRVQEITGTTGTGTVTLGGAVLGYQSFSTVGNGNTTYYTIVDLTAGDWEVGIGTYNSATPSLSRDTVLSSSNAGSLVPFGVGTKNVFVTYPSERSVYLDQPGSYPVQNTFNSLTAATATLTAGTVSTTPSSGTDLANKSYVDTVAAAGIHYHAPVYVESPNTAGNLNAAYNQPGGSGVGVGATLTNAGAKAALTIDGILMTTTKRVLIYNQTNAYENGVYTVTTVGTPDPGGTNWVLTRATDADTYAPSSPNSLGQGDAFFVTNGDTGAGEGYVCTTVGPITFGTTAITFSQFSAAQVYNAGTGLNLSPATTFNISNTGVTAATYGSASQVPVFAVNAQGQVTSVTNTSIAIAAGAVSGLAASATTDTTNATNITSGTLPSGRLSGSYTGITGVGTLTAGTWNGSVIGPVYGGTGFGTYAVGDLLYADTTSTLAKLADVAVGNALISGGVGSAPSWGKIGLATHTSGILPVANGGTGVTSSTGTGSVVLSDSPSLVTPILGTPQSGNFSTGSFTWPTFNQNTTGSAGSVANALTINNGGAGAVSGSTFNGSSAVTISYNTVGAPSTTGTNASGTWGISISGNAATATTATNQSGGTVSATTGAFSSNITVGTGLAVDPSNVSGFAAGQITESSTGFSAPGIVVGSGSGQHGAIVYGSSTMYFGTENGADNTMNTRATLTSGGAFNTTGAITQNGSQVLTAGNYNSYALPLAGGTMTGNILVSSTSVGAQFGNLSVGYGGAYNTLQTKDGTSSLYLQYASTGTIDIGTGGGYTTINQSTRSPIFYDSNDTGYYIDPNSTSNSALRMRGGALFGPNTTWGAYLAVGTNGNTNTAYASVAATNGNLHMDAASGYSMYLNYYAGSNVYFGNGASGGIYAQVASDGSFRSPIYYDYQNTGYYVDPASTSNINQLNMNGPIVRTVSGQGYLNGNYSSSETVSTSGAIYSIGGSYVPGTTTLGNMYGVGYTYTGSGRAVGNPAGAQSDLWGLYGAAAGTANWFLDASNGRGYFASQVNATIFYDTNDTSYYLNPNSISQLNYVLANDWFRPQGNTGLYFQTYGYGIWSPDAAGGNYGNVSTYGTGKNSWNGYNLGGQWTLMNNANGDNIGVHSSSTSWLWYWDGTSTTWSRGYNQFANSIRSPIFYDSNNTAYYCNPNDESVFSTLTAVGSCSFTASNYSIFAYGNGNTGAVSSVGLQIYSTGGAGATMAFHRSGYYAVNMGLDSDNVLRIGGWSASANLWQLDMSGNNYLSGSSRAPIFYDSDNTSYYTNPAGTSVLNGLSVNFPYILVGGATIGTTTGSPSYFMARAWLNYSGVSQTIRASVNVSSVTYVGVGDYVVNFSTAMPDINYATTVSCGRNGTGVGGYLSIVSDRIAQTTSAVQVYTFTFSGAATDTPYIAVHVFR